MSVPTYAGADAGDPKPLAVLGPELVRPDLSPTGRLRLAVLLERLRGGESLTFPESRPMPSIGRGCHELRFRDGERKRHWRVVYRADEDAIVLVDAFVKTSRATPKRVLDRCRRRLRLYDGA